MIDLTKLYGITGEVTQEDIDHGIRGCHEQCALARAVERMLPGYDIFVDDYIAVSNQKGEVATELAISTAILKWIDRFDNEKPVNPIPLAIFMAMRGINPWILCMGKDDYERFS